MRQFSDKNHRERPVNIPTSETDGRTENERGRNEDGKESTSRGIFVDILE